MLGNVGGFFLFEDRCFFRMCGKMLGTVRRFGEMLRKCWSSWCVGDVLGLFGTFWKMLGNVVFFEICLGNFDMCQKTLSRRPLPLK